MIQKIITDQQLGAVIFWRPDELVMSLGYQPYMGISLAVFYQEGSSKLYVPENEPPWLLPKNIQICTIPSGMADDYWGTLFESIQNDLQARNIVQPVGIVTYIGQSSPPCMSAEGASLPSDFIQRLQTLSPNGLVDITQSVVTLYQCKNMQAIEGIRLAQHVADVGIRAFYKNIVVGNREVDIKIAIESSITAMIGTDNIHTAQGWAAVQSGEHSKDAGTFSITKGSFLKNGELVMLELAVCVNGYWADLSRTGYVGEATQEVIKLYDIVEEAQKAALQVVKHEAKHVAVYRAAMEVIRKHGYEKCFNHALGHGVGYRYHDLGAPLTPYSDGNTLVEGMVITIEPGIYGDSVGGGIRIEDNILVTQEGYELLSTAPRGLKGEQ